MDDKEAPIRKMMFELFLVHKRKMKVATVLNEKGYRTRKGEPFNPTMIRRCLEDPIAKGLRRMNYNSSSGDRKNGRLKPQEEWIFGEAPAIVTEELWEQCNKIIASQKGSEEKVRRPNVHLFSGVIYCHCGSKMYMRSNSPRYVCKDYKNCKNQILPDDLEFIYQEQLKDLLFSETSLQKHVGEEKERLIGLEQELKGHKQRTGELTEKIQKLLDLYYEGKVKKEDFEGYHEPLALELSQRQTSFNDIQAKLDVLNMDSLNNEYILQEAKDLHSQWAIFTSDEKKTIITAITKSITIGEEEIDIQLKAIPTLSKRPIAESNIASIQMLTFAPHPTSFKLVQQMNEPVAGR
ncbi:MAG: recombinase family protein [Sphingobacteriales bacterium JAD_PAG50586_3]|nr:MAG: recombinase family protein [Sphingobacteriales bacterium JAD_PAG50586_3]